MRCQARDGIGDENCGNGLRVNCQVFQEGFVMHRGASHRSSKKLRRVGNETNLERDR